MISVCTQAARKGGNHHFFFTHQQFTFSCCNRSCRGSKWRGRLMGKVGIDAGDEIVEGAGGYWRRVSITVSSVATKRLPPALCVPEESLRRMPA